MARAEPARSNTPCSTNTVNGNKVRVLFNPEEYTVNRDVQDAQIAVPGLSAPVVQFVHGNAQTLDMELFLDTLEKNSQAPAGSDVRKLVEKITSFMDIDPTMHAPPPVLFTWASLSFTCVLQKASQKFIMFKPDGTPVRASLEVTFRRFSETSTWRPRRSSARPPTTPSCTRSATATPWP